MPTLIFSRVGACPPCSPRAGAHVVKETAVESFESVKVQDSIDVKFEELTKYNKLIALKTNKSPGPDSIHPMFLSKTATAIAKPLSVGLAYCSTVHIQKQGYF